MSLPWMHYGVYSRGGGVGVWGVCIGKGMGGVYRSGCGCVVCIGMGVCMHGCVCTSGCVLCIIHIHITHDLVPPLQPPSHKTHIHTTPSQPTHTHTTHTHNPLITHPHTTHTQGSTVGGKCTEGTGGLLAAIGISL